MLPLAALAMLAAAMFTGTADAQDMSFWIGGEGYACRPTIRRDVFEFTAPPAVRKAGRDLYEITFAVKDFCDVTVGIVRRQDGRIVRHLASGVLGRNAPPPLQSDRLAQKLTWDGKDDRSRYVADPAGCVVRVSLGMKPSFAGVYGWHPKDSTGQIEGLGAGPEGVFVLIGERRPQVRQFDHQGRYARTVFPPPANVPAEQLDGMKFVALPDGGQAIYVAPYGSLLPLWYGDAPAQSLAVGGGNLFLVSPGGTVERRLYPIRIATGGPPAGKSALVLSRLLLDGSQHMAVSPGGESLYVSGLWTKRGSRGSGLDAVYKVSWRGEPPLMGRAFFGEPDTPKADNEHLSAPEGIAADAQGRVYVADRGNGRIVVLSPEGRFLKAIPLAGVVNVAVHHASGAIYAMSLHTDGPEWRRTTTKRFTRLGGLDDARPQATGEVVCPPSRYARQDETLFCLDSWAKQPTIWTTQDPGGIVLLADRGDRFEQVADFAADVRAAGLIPGMITGGRMPKVVGDTVRPYVYYYPGGQANSSPFRIHLDGGKVEQIQIPSPADDIAFDAEGRLYCRAFRCLSRHNAETMAEIPFDYGEPVQVRHARFNGAIPLKDMAGAKGYQDGFGIGVDGRIVVVSNIFSWTGWLLDRRGTQDLSENVGGLGPIDDKMRERYIADSTKLPISPGRNIDRQGTVWVYDAGGQLVAEDVLKGPVTGTIGAGIDRDGAVYVAANMTKSVDGKRFLPGYATGTIMKAPAAGARIVGDWGDRARAPLEPLPTRPADFTVAAAAPNVAHIKGQTFVSGADRRALAGLNLAGSGGVRLWQTGLAWAYPGASEIVPATGACTCPNLRFGFDYYARSFVPEAYRFSVGVLDSNGNLVLHVGRYGNADSGRGPDSPVPAGDDGLAFAFPSYLSAIDGWLFVSDAGNDRILRVKLGYHAEQDVDLAAAAGE